MGCPRCGKQWQRVEANKLTCSCGCIEVVKPTYKELLAENKKLKADVAWYKERWMGSGSF